MYHQEWIHTWFKLKEYETEGGVTQCKLGMYLAETNNIYVHHSGYSEGRERYTERRKIKTDPKDSFHSSKSNPDIPGKAAEVDKEAKILIQLNTSTVSVSNSRC